MTLPRRRWIGALASSLALPALATPARLIAPMTDGPFYPPERWRSTLRTDWDADLTHVDGVAAMARGEHLGLTLQLLGKGGRPLAGAEVEIWQCDALAAYRHPQVSPTPGRFDPAFQGFGSARSYAEGLVRFRTIRPVPYPGRTPHIHVKLRHEGFGEISSQLFVAGDPGNARDFLWRQLDAADQAALAMTLAPADGRDGLRWQARQVLVLPA